MIKFYINIFLFPILCFSQVESVNFEQNVNGIITTDEETYLVTEQGVIQIDRTDIYQEYYRRIYNDSTIVNPNTEIKSNFTLNIIPFLSPSINKKYFEFEKPLMIGVFVKYLGNGSFGLTNYGQEFVDSIKTRMK